uniref:Uncharacterized protein n=1 Tax=Rhizophora mucronata TaxID=61149 RepID=A0A2P2N3M3_RHIMU
MDVNKFRSFHVCDDLTLNMHHFLMHPL